MWAEARTLALTPAQVASPLAGRPYDLRHAAVSLWLAAGVPPPRVAERAGHSVQVLLRVYVKCLDDGEDTANTRIDTALREPDTMSWHQTWTKASSPGARYPHVRVDLRQMRTCRRDQAPVSTASGLLEHDVELFESSPDLTGELIGVAHLEVV